MGFWCWGWVSPWPCCVLLLLSPMDFTICAKTKQNKTRIQNTSLTIQVISISFSLTIPSPHSQLLISSDYAQGRVQQNSANSFHNLLILSSKQHNKTIHIMHITKERSTSVWRTNSKKTPPLLPQTPNFNQSSGHHTQHAHNTHLAHDIQVLQNTNLTRTSKELHMIRLGNWHDGNCHY